jgi:hypothetical protein
LTSPKSGGDVKHTEINIGPKITTQPGHTGAEAASNIMGSLRDQYGLGTRQFVPNVRRARRRVGWHSGT